MRKIIRDDTFKVTFNTRFEDQKATQIFVLENDEVVTYTRIIPKINKISIF